jgi:hypothetical protein
MKNASGYPSWANNAVIKRFQCQSLFIVWRFAINRKANIIIWLYWYEWEVNEDIEFDVTGKNITKPQDPTLKNQGVGQGTETTGVTPKMKGKITAVGYTTSEPIPGGYAVRITPK